MKSFDDMGMKELTMLGLQRQEEILDKLGKLEISVDSLHDGLERFDDHASSENVRLAVWGGIIAVISLSSSLLISIFM